MRLNRATAGRPYGNLGRHRDRPLQNTGFFSGGRGAVGIAFFEPADETEQAVKDSQRMRRAAGDIEIHGDDRIGAVVGLRVIDKGAAGHGTGADGNHDAGVWQSVVGFFQGQMHVLGDGACD